MTPLKALWFWWLRLTHRRRWVVCEDPDELGYWLEER